MSELARLRVLRFVRDFQASKGRSPLQKEIAYGLQWRSRGSVARALREGEERGWYRRNWSETILLPEGIAELARIDADTISRAAA